MEPAAAILILTQLFAIIDIIVIIVIKLIIINKNREVRVFTDSELSPEFVD